MGFEERRKADRRGVIKKQERAWANPPHTSGASRASEGPSRTTCRMTQVHSFIYSCLPTPPVTVPSPRYSSREKNARCSPSFHWSGPDSKALTLPVCKPGPERRNVSPFSRGAGPQAGPPGRHVDALGITPGSQPPRSVCGGSLIQCPQPLAVCRARRPLFCFCPKTWTKHFNSLGL